MTEYFIRHQDLVSKEARSQPITIIGAGAVGGYAALALAKMGFVNITIWDGDVVGEENVGVQVYGPEHIEEMKAFALQSIIKSLSSITIQPHAERWSGDEKLFPLEGIIISCIDNMEGRRELWQYVKARPMQCSTFIDSRMGAEQAQLFVMKPLNSDDVRSYEKTLYSDDEALAEACTARSTSYTAMLLGGVICKAVKDVVMDAAYSRIMHWDIRNNTQERQLSVGE